MSTLDNDRQAYEDENYYVVLGRSDGYVKHISHVPCYVMLRVTSSSYHGITYNVTICILDSESLHTHSCIHVWKFSWHFLFRIPIIIVNCWGEE